MATITITGPIEVCDDKSSESITDPRRLKSLDGVAAKGAQLADDLDGDLAHLGIAGGGLKLRYDSQQMCLLIETSYEAPQRLSPKQLRELVAYTRDQWSDGAGEGAFYKLLDKHRVGMDLTPSGSERRTKVEQSDGGGRKLKPTPVLAVAAEKGDISKVEQLLASGADINTRGKHRQTALQTAILYSHFKLAALLIDSGADVNATDQDGGTPLATAVMSGHFPTVKRLINAGADVNGADKEGATPLMWAANRDSVAIVKLLLENGADPNAKDRVKDNPRRTPLKYAQPGSKQVIELLIAYGARPPQPKPSAVAQALEKAQACDTIGDRRQAKKWLELAAQLQKFSK